jgi:large subunit ribosomal protein L29
MKFSEIKNKTKNELSEMLKDLKGNLSRFNFQLSGNTLKNSSQIGKTKKDIARIMTALNKNK